MRSVQVLEMYKLKKLFSREAFWHNLDTYILILASVLLAIASMTGYLVDEKLGGAIVALLGVLAFSQLMSRFQVEEVANTWHRARTDIFSTRFPHEYDEAKEKILSSYFYAGETMGRTMPTMETHIKRVLKKGGSVRILLPDPNSDQLMTIIAKTRSDKTALSIRNSIENSFQLARELCTDDNDIELRTTDVLPHIGINGLDIGEPSGKIVVQMYEYKSSSERAPIFLLEADDGEWFKHFSEQIERLWACGKEYVPEGDGRGSDIAGKGSIPPGP